MVLLLVSEEFSLTTICTNSDYNNMNHNLLTSSFLPLESPRWSKFYSFIIGAQLLAKVYEKMAPMVQINLETS